MTNVLIIDDHPVVRMAMIFVIRDIYQDANIFEANEFPEGISILNNNPISLVILDIHIPGGQDIKMISMIKSLQHKTKVLIFSGLHEDQYALKYVQAGADGFLSKRSDPESYGEAITTVLNNEIFLSKSIRDKVQGDLAIRQSPIRAKRWVGLTERELEISRLLIKGYWTKEIAVELDLKLSTVSTFKKKIFSKCGVTNVVELSKIIDDVLPTPD